MRVVHGFWVDEGGFVISAELVLIATILLIGMVVGLTTIRDQAVQELADVAAAISQLNQSYSFSAIVGHHSFTAGSVFIDLVDICDAVPDRVGLPAAGVEICIVPATPEAGF